MGEVTDIRFNGVLAPIYFQLEYGNRLCPVTNLFDMYREETIDPRRACAAVVFLGGDKWLALTIQPEDLIPVDPHTTH